VPALTETMAVEAVKEVLGNTRRRDREVDPSVELESLGLDSLEVAELFAVLEEFSGLQLDPDSAQSLVTVGDLARLRPVGGDQVNATAGRNGGEDLAASGG
jgi:acyl carrier protein